MFVEQKPDIAVLILFIVFLLSLDREVQKERGRGREGRADISTRKGRKRRPQAKVKRPHSPVQHCRCVFEWPVMAFQLAFFSPFYSQGYLLCRRHSETCWKGQIASLYVSVLPGWTQWPPHRGVCRFHTVKSSTLYCLPCFLLLWDVRHNNSPGSPVTFWEFSRYFLSFLPVDNIFLLLSQ